MGSYCYSPEPDSPASVGGRCPSPGFATEKTRRRKKKQSQEETMLVKEELFGADAYGEMSMEDAWGRKGKKKGGGGGGGGGGGVMLEGYVDGWEQQGSDGGLDGGAVGRTKSLTDEDLEELKGCLDLGFGFCYEDIPELCNTLPALELCYSMSQRFQDEQQQQQHQQQIRPPEIPGAAAEHSHAASSPIANWKISSPGDHPEEVKARLKYWAQAVACTVRLCS